ncbi:MAG: hypothetical protein K8I27_04795 [Planctomycetes bacterium]|nr:hypothetical protein [Planctomycetota bacterium]
MTKEPSLSDQLRALLPEPTDELTAALDKVAQLEHEHSTTVEQARIERAFLERAPREGLLYPGDALKLGDFRPDEDLDKVFTQLRATRPYLFDKASSPANQKLAEHDPDSLRRALKHGSLTRQVQEIRRRRPRP